MGKICHLTDTHLNFIDDIESWWADILLANNDCDCFLFTGDVSTSSNIQYVLDIFESTSKPVYYVLGNHDYYSTSIETLRDDIGKRKPSNVTFLTQSNPIVLSPTSILIGDDGWYDGRNGTYWASNESLNDFRYIKEFKGHGKQARLMIMQRYADRSANRISELIKKAIVDHPQMNDLYIATHVPPFANAAWYMGKKSNNDFLPFFSNFCVGSSIESSSKEFRESGKNVWVYCGHTHCFGVTSPAENLNVITSGAQYYKPKVSNIINYE